MIMPDKEKFKEERDKWKAEGSPLRPEEKVKELFTICSSNECGKYIEITQRLGQCGVCSCFLRPRGTIGNKLSWSTTRCPLSEPKWVEEPGFEKKEETIPEESIPPQFNTRAKKGGRGGCGCT